MTTMSSPRYNVFSLENENLYHRLTMQKDTRCQEHFAGLLVGMSPIKLQGRTNYDFPK